MVQRGVYGKAERGRSAARILGFYHGGPHPQTYPEPGLIHVNVADGLTSLTISLSTHRITVGGRTIHGSIMVHWVDRASASTVLSRSPARSHRSGPRSAPRSSVATLTALLRVGDRHQPAGEPARGADVKVLRRAAKPFLDRSLDVPGMIHPVDVVVRSFAAMGWGWGGGDWNTLKDYMHFLVDGSVDRAAEITCKQPIRCAGHSPSRPRRSTRDSMPCLRSPHRRA
jgi:hypothetical protein